MLNLLIVLAAFLTALLSTLFIVRSGKVHAHRSGDHDFAKPQGIHAVAVPRIGGLGIVTGLLAVVGVLTFSGREADARALLWVLVCASPAFIAGFVQDFTGVITPRGRIFAAAVSAGMAFMVMDAGIRVTGIPGLDWLVAYTAGSLLVTVFTVAGIANAINIIDGLNGLASMCAMLMLGAVAYVAYQVDDPLIGVLALAGIGAVLGFFLWNFPAGLIFLGDGGAYFLGFFIAELCILLLVRNSEVSPLFPLLVCIYPVFETLFSIYRRLVLRQCPPHMPDGIHLHSLIYRRLVRWALVGQDNRTLVRKNSLTAPYLWVLCLFSLLPAVVFWNSTLVLACCLMLFAVSYTFVYWQIVRFRTPGWLMPRRRSGKGQRNSPRAAPPR